MMLHISSRIVRYLLLVGCLSIASAFKQANSSEDDFGDSNQHLLTINLQDVPLRDALQVMADELELNLVLSDDVTANVSIHVEQLDIIQALDMLLFGRELSFRLYDNFLAVGLSSQLLALDQEQQLRKQAAAQLHTGFLQLNYADGQVLLPMLADLLSAQGSAQVDVRTNTLIVHDTQASLQAVRDMVQVLDVPVRQVLIEARIVSAALDSGRDLGVRWGFSRMSGLPRDQQLLDLEISALERAGEAELIARPRVTTQDNMPALIQSGVRLPYQAQAGGTAGGSTTEFVDALLSLDVTPLITPDGRIIMRLGIRQDSVASGSGEVPAINTNTITTSVLVDNGDTLVLGGIFREEQTRAETGTPGLRRIPVVGGLFRRHQDSSHRTELLIFITPEIVTEALPILAADAL